MRCRSRGRYQLDRVWAQFDRLLNGNRTLSDFQLGRNLARREVPFLSHPDFLFQLPAVAIPRGVLSLDQIIAVAGPLWTGQIQNFGLLMYRQLIDSVTTGLVSGLESVLPGSMLR